MVLDHQSSLSFHAIKIKLPAFAEFSYRIGGPQEIKQAISSAKTVASQKGIVQVSKRRATTWAPRFITIPGHTPSWEHNIFTFGFLIRSWHYTFSRNPSNQQSN
jgi:hypothetical protein